MGGDGEVSGEWVSGGGGVSGMEMVEGVGGFFFNDTATTEIYTLSLHDALPIFRSEKWSLLMAGCCRSEKWSV